MLVTDNLMSPPFPPTPMPLSAFATSLPGEVVSVLPTLATLGFTHVDLVAEIDRPPQHLEALADSGLLVSCLALGRGLPPGHGLDAVEIGVRRATLALLQRQIIDAARLGATTAYLVPPLTPNPSPQSGEGSNSAALTYFMEGCVLLADYAAERGIRLCVEHVPGRALPTAARTLDWLERSGHNRLALLLDVGHCLMSGEDAAELVRRAGPRLGYVHLDDNDGSGDLHWPLLSGRLTELQLTATIQALRAIHYSAALALELHPASSDPVAALHNGKTIVQRLLGDA